MAGSEVNGEDGIMGYAAEHSVGQARFVPSSNRDVGPVKTRLGVVVATTSKGIYEI